MSSMPLLPSVLDQLIISYETQLIQSDKLQKVLSQMMEKIEERTEYVYYMYYRYGGDMDMEQNTFNCSNEETDEEVRYFEYPLENKIVRSY